MLNDAPIDTNQRMESLYSLLAAKLLQCNPVDRGEVHAQKLTKPEEMMLELNHMAMTFSVDNNFAAWQETVRPNLPWAEDHFLERISGEPLNPPPSEAYWPFAQAGNSAHKKDAKFSHTYPERFWPKQATDYPEYTDINGDDYKIKTINTTPVHRGIRFEYGDLQDLLVVLNKNMMSRQAYLPVWFPEDLAAARQGERVPCTLGYHFLYDPPSGKLDCSYFMRSCDIVRFFRDDVYMAGRLLQYVCHKQGAIPGRLILHIANLHAFVGDRYFLTDRLSQLDRVIQDPRAGYNFGALG